MGLGTDGATCLLMTEPSTTHIFRCQTCDPKRLGWLGPRASRLSTFRRPIPAILTPNAQAGERMIVGVRPSQGSSHCMSACRSDMRKAGGDAMMGCRSLQVSRGVPAFFPRR